MGNSQLGVSGVGEREWEERHKAEFLNCSSQRRRKRERRDKNAQRRSMESCEWKMHTRYTRHVRVVRLKRNIAHPLRSTRSRGHKASQTPAAAIHLRETQEDRGGPGLGGLVRGRGTKRQRNVRQQQVPQVPHRCVRNKMVSIVNCPTTVEGVGQTPRQPRPGGEQQNARGRPAPTS